MRVVLTAAAIADLDRATRWYGNHGEGLAARFLDEFEVLLARLADNPLQFPAIRGPAYRASFH
jgi:plasmid stabilization system protein ParE